MTEFCWFNRDTSHPISPCSDCCLPGQSDHQLHWQYRYCQCSYFSYCLTNTCLLITQSNSRFGFISRTSWKWMWIGGANRPAAFRVAWSAITKNCREIMSKCAYNVAQVRFLPLVITHYLNIVSSLGTNSTGVVTFRQILFLNYNSSNEVKLVKFWTLW